MCSVLISELAREADVEPWSNTLGMRWFSQRAESVNQRVSSLF